MASLFLKVDFRLSLGNVSHQLITHLMATKGRKKDNILSKVQVFL